MKQARKQLLKPISLWPLKAEDALRAFMQIDPKRLRRRLKRKGL